MCTVSTSAGRSCREKKAGAHPEGKVERQAEAAKVGGGEGQAFGAEDVLGVGQRTAQDGEAEHEQERAHGEGHGELARFEREQRQGEERDEEADQGAGAAEEEAEEALPSAERVESVQEPPRDYELGASTAGSLAKTEAHASSSFVRSALRRGM